MSTEMQIAIVGVVGTLAGTFLGWLLNHLSQRGKIHIYVTSFMDEFKYNKIGCMVPSSSIAQTESYRYKLVLDLYNSSGETKILRNLTIVFSDGKTDLFKSTPNDDSTGRPSGPIWFYDEIAPINIPPKSITQLNLHNGASHQNDGLDFIWKTKKIYMTYTNEKNKLCKIHIKSEDYSSYFENHKVENVSNNGRQRI